MLEKLTHVFPLIFLCFFLEQESQFHFHHKYKSIYFYVVARGDIFGLRGRLRFERGTTPVANHVGTFSQRLMQCGLIRQRMSAWHRAYACSPSGMSSRVARANHVLPSHAKKAFTRFISSSNMR